MTASICTEPDVYLGQCCDKNAIWSVVLSDGTTVFQDDYRPEVYPESAWVRLKQYCKETGLYIKSMKVAFRSHEVDVGEEEDGVYFCKGASAFMTSNITNELYIVGTLNDGVLRVEKWKVPELIKEGTELRNASIAGDCLISRHGKE